MKLTKILPILFSVKNGNNHNVVTIFGLKIKIRKGEVSIVHFSAFTRGNAGDYILVHALKKSVEKIINKKINWIDYFIHNQIDKNIEDIINSSDAMLVGGGGLFLKDTNPNKISGWQFPITAQNLERIKVPLYMLAVGYNRFRSQDDFEPYFTDNINAFTHKSEFIGLRNNGSIQAIKSYLQEDLKSKVIFHPCPTTIISKIFELPKTKQDKPFIAINCAFDRSEMRYGKNKDEILSSIAKATQKLSKKYEIKYYVHVETDKEALPYFDKNDCKYTVVNLNAPLTMDDVLQLYTSPSLVIGMRGHAQMIPFGCCTPILSIISHDKMNWFLEDINHTEWGIDVLSKNFEQELYDKALHILDNKNKIKKQIKFSQNILYSITVNNIKYLNKILRKQKKFQKKEI